MIRPRELIGKIINDHPWIIILYSIWNFMAFIISIVQMGPPPVFGWNSPFMHLMYATPLYWVPVGAVDLWRSIDPFFKWFFGV